MERREHRLAFALVAPALVVVLGVAIVPVAATAWEALHRHDLRLPWLGTPFAGLDNFAEAVQDARFQAAFLRTLAFAAVSVPLELALGLALALLMHKAVGGRGAMRVAVLLPWAIPTVVAALVWRFMFDAQTGVVNVPLRASGLVGSTFDWFVHPVAAWVPIVGADVWKTTPFVAILLLAGLQGIDPELQDAARIDGAGPVRRFVTITLPLLMPALIAAAAFRTLDAIRLFDLSYVLTGGGPGTATEPLSLYAFVALMQRLRFGYGSALSMLVFLLAFVFALASARALAAAMLLLLLFPVLWMVLASFTPESQLFDPGAAILPSEPSLAHYRALFSERSFLVPIRNSLIVAGLTTAVAIPIAALCAYALARLRMPGKGALLALILAVSMFPQISVVAPLYLLLRDLRLIDTYPGLVVPYLTFSTPLAVWLLTGFLRQLPPDLEEAAMVDGAGRLRAMRDVVLPLASPGIASTAILTFLYCWNEFLFALAFTSAPDSQTVPVAIAFFRGRYQVPWGQVLAAASIATIPVALVVFAFQRRIVAGLTLGATKG